MTHTPGPWRMFGQDGRLIESADGYYVAEAVDIVPGFAANARLIASAPDLLAELRAAENVLTEYAAYAEAMRQVGRGMEPTDIYGRRIDATLGGIRAAIRAAREG